jgi:hypothetical protein
MRSNWVLKLVVCVCFIGVVVGQAGIELPGGKDFLKPSVELFDDVIIFEISRPYQRADLVVSGPRGEVYSVAFAASDTAYFDFIGTDGEALADGSYTWELRTTPVISEDTLELFNEIRESGDDELLAEMRANGEIPFGEMLSGHFTLENGSPAYPDEAEKYQILDQVILDDLIVDGSLCVGFDCVNGESFGFDTIRVKENNVRIKFDDTSTSASFPRNDWQLTANDSSNGGANKFSIDDITGGRTPFTIEAGAQAHALYLDGHKVGFGTSTPVVELHVVDGDTPTLRLEQDGSSGFAPQTWDVAGNETNYFIRDVTNGSKLPLRIRPGAPTSSIDIASDGDVGIGTASPEAPLHVHSTDVSETVLIKAESTQDANTFITVENSGGDAGVFRAMAGSTVVNFQAHDPVRTISRFGETLGGWSEFLQVGGDGLIIGTLSSKPLILGTNSANVLEITPAGAVIHRGSTTVHADYVFYPDYRLPSIEDHAAFMWDNKHLKAVGPASRDEQGKEFFTLGTDRRGIVEELEVAHIYIEQLNDRLKDLELKNEMLLKRLESLERAKDDR